MCTKHQSGPNVIVARTDDCSEGGPSAEVDRVRIAEVEDRDGREQGDDRLRLEHSSSIRARKRGNILLLLRTSLRTRSQSALSRPRAIVFKWIQSARALPLSLSFRTTWCCYIVRRGKGAR